ncbi:MAG: sigma-70 family RNA polymerase sigma factor [Acidobacteriota bacterium]|nr:sigma-70 family RNA polymerase sigma factor [Acidobacteriota bacterium]MDQ7087764.1 sigma-70 family RNA polymerase sigma factor [Acidobacteriota bacterium]
MASGENPAARRRLLDRLRAGEEAAFEELVRDEGGRLLSVIRRYLRDEEEARDALQETFLSAFRALDRFEGGAQLSTWLHRIAVNAALMRLRSRGRRPEGSIEELLPHFREDGHHARPVGPWRPEALEALEREETRRFVRRSIDALPENYRNVLLLRDIEGFDTSETAVMLGVTPNAVKIRLHRARQALRTLLAREMGGEAP